MPLIKSKSKEAVSENIRREKAAGAPQDQAVAIALSVQREAEKRSRKAAGYTGSAEDKSNETKDHSKQTGTARTHRDGNF